MQSWCGYDTYYLGLILYQDFTPKSGHDWLLTFFFLNYNIFDLETVQGNFVGLDPRLENLLTTFGWLEKKY